jgi:hypothetical protein
MRKPIAPRDWLKDDHSQCEWLFDYLVKNGALPSYSQNTSWHYLVSTLDQIRAQHGGEAFFQRVKRAWNNHQFKQRQDKKTYSFVLSSTAHSKLRRLAKNKPKGQVLEDLINRGHDLENELRRERRQEIKQEKEQLQEQKLQAPNGLKTEIAERNRGLSEYHATLEKVIHEKCLYERMLEAGVSQAADLTDDQRLEIDRRKDALTRHYCDHIQSRMKQPEGI